MRAAQARYEAGTRQVEALGCGAKPDWLQRAIHAGQTVEHFWVPIAGVTGAL